ncbi:hypothetical protein F4825DRAFT_468384 [Nemania diffusa]|nr:hypothetical protein F4825DRAFT_468384 [Nemania diffusa]
MGSPQSKEIGCGLDSGTTHRNLSDEELQQDISSQTTGGLSTAARIPPAMPTSSSSISPSPFTIPKSQKDEKPKLENQTGKDPKSSATSDDEDDEDLITLLRKHQKSNTTGGKAKQVIRQDDRKSLDIEFSDPRSNQPESKPLPSQHRVRFRVRFSGGLLERNERANAKKVNAQTESDETAEESKEPTNQSASSSSDKARKHARLDDEENGLDIDMTKPPTESFPVAKKRLISPTSSGYSTEPIIIDDSDEDDDVAVQKPKLQVSYSYGARKSMPALIRRTNNSVAYLDTVPEEEESEQPQKEKNAAALMDSGEITNTVSQPEVPEPQLNRAHVPNAPENHPLDNAPQNSGRPQLPRPPAETREALKARREAQLIRQYERRPREYVTPACKWAYTIKYVGSKNNVITDEDLKFVQTYRSFADRKRANEWLDKNSVPETIGGLEAIVRRTASFEGPERLLRVELQSTENEYYYMWVDRIKVTLSEQTADKRKQEQWKPTPRAKLPHFVVTGSLGTTSDSKPVFAVAGSDDGMSLGSLAVPLKGMEGEQFGLDFENLPMATFTIREMANEHARQLFCEHTRVDPRWAKQADVDWWKRVVKPELLREMRACSGPDGLFSLHWEAHDMSPRLGWNKIMVEVTKVDDISGPVNF